MIQDVQVVGGDVGDVVQMLLARVDTEDSLRRAACGEQNRMTNSITSTIRRQIKYEANEGGH